MTYIEAIERYTCATSPALREQFGESAYSYVNGDDQYVAFRDGSGIHYVNTVFPLEMVTTSDWDKPSLLVMGLAYTNFEVRYEDIRDVAASDFISNGSTRVPDGVRVLDFKGMRDRLSFVVVPEGTEEIENNAFLGCSKLSSIRLPGSITRVGSRAFNDCDSLTSIDIPDGVTEIGENAFGGCIGLTSVKLPRGLIELGANAFRSCTNLKSIAIPEGVTRIGFGAFYDCRSLESIVIPRGVTEIKELTFRDCYSLSSVKLPRECRVDSIAFDRKQDIDFTYWP